MTAIATLESVTSDLVQTSAGPYSVASLPTVRLPEAGHGIALIILATVAVIFALDWAQSTSMASLVVQLQKN